MPNIKIITQEKEYTVLVEENILLSQVLHTARIAFSMPCAGNHTCGKCVVFLKENEAGLSAMTREEEKLMTKDQVAQGARLACFAKALEDCTVAVTVSSQGEDAIQTAFQNELSFEKGNSGYGFAVDIGTTTVVSYLYSLSNGKLLSTIGEMNQQSSYGADVISRIDYNRGEQESKLHFRIKEQLSNMFHRNLTSACKAQRILPSEINRIVITGNTTMLHFLMNYPADGIAVAPFTPHSLFGMEQKASILFEAYENATLYLPHCIGAYVGADAVCAILASDMIQKQEDKNYLMADIGTNGEMALFHQGKLFTCSTAAGPAFEGAGIKMGMTAKTGAVTDISVINGEIHCVTIGDASPVGLCGTGLINSFAKLLALGVIDSSGLINEEAEEYVDYDEEGDLFIALGNSGVIITQKDIRQIQLAKSAIHAGILTLCHECGIKIEDVDTLYLCGGFGSVIDPQNAGKIGLIPTALTKRVVPLGNGAGLGASMILQSKANQALSKQIAEMAEEIPLSTSAYFMEQYVEQMMF